MQKKWVALALVGAAALLYKTKKGQEIRQTVSAKAGELGTKLKDAYQQRTSGGQSKNDPAQA